MNLTGVVLTRNEEKYIEECIKNLSFCSEIVVIDDNSTDKTNAIAKRNGAKVYRHGLSDFATQRNFAISKATSEWILFVDADERIDDELRKEILQKVSHRPTDVVGFFIERHDVLWGRQLKNGDVANARFLRLARRNAGKWEGEVHERWSINGKTESLQNHMLHYPHQSLSEFLTEINFYSDLRSRELFKQDIKVSPFEIIGYPKLKFLTNYIIRLGFLDGTEGLVHATMMSLYSFLVRAKLWLLWQKKVHS